MKQKQVKSSPKAAKLNKSVSASATPKKVHKVVEETDDEEEEVVQEKVVVKKPTNKKKAAKVVVEEPEVCEEEDEDDEVEDNEEESDDDVNDEEVDDDNDEEVDDEAVDDDDNEEEVEDNDEENDDDESNDAEEEEDDECTSPSEIIKGPLPSDCAPHQCIHVAKLPKKCTQIDIVEAFAKYGPIKQINIVTTHNGASADIAYKTAKAAAAAIAANKKVKVGENFVFINKFEANVTNKRELGRERCVYVRNFKIGTTEEELRELFKPCGDIEYFKLTVKRPPMAFVTFAEKTAVSEALKLHNTIFNDSNIKVYEHGENKGNKQYKEDLTIMLRNKQELTSIDVAKLESIFSKCGEIDYIDLVCKKQVLAFITFKNEKAAEKALKLSGKTQQDIILDIETYSPFKKLTTIHLVNIPKDCTETDLRTHFAKAGEIVNVMLKRSSAVIRFEDSDGFCKSFLYNESFLKGNMIFIEPFSTRKTKVLHNTFNKRAGNKRPFQNGHSGFKSKRPKLN